jgi:multicomponent Na+:H+ antiporter subunit E
MLSIVISILSIIFIHLLFSDVHYTKSYRVSVTTLVKYFVVLLFNIYKSAFITIYNIFSDNINPTFINIKTGINNQWYKCIIANSITLTPGTVSVEMNNEEITVLWLNPTTKSNEEAGKIIKGDFENILEKEDN